ncbi:MAG: MobC family plasmid mobilization relaxosome protein [Oscillospiraceae bacterium]|jgi:hypothetical protein|nr:MobC family plasmid mobilization relaxosome protein [Oscillospiraceae bacterium]
MLKRNIKVTFRLDKSENENFKKYVKKSGLSQEAYLRHLINGLIPTDVPPPDYYTMIRELHAIGTNLNQIARKAHVLNVMDTMRYDTAVDMLNKAIVDITNAVMLPRKIK